MATKTNGDNTNVRNITDKMPPSQRLLEEGQRYLQARAQHAVRSITDRVSDLGHNLDEYAESGGAGAKALAKGAQEMSEGGSPARAVAKAGATGVKEKVRELFGGGKGSGSVKAVNIVEDIDVGVPVSVAYNQWTQFREFSQFAKGPQQVDQQEDEKTRWTAKIAWSTRSWSSTITEQVPDERIAWTSEGDKGYVNGVVTFHEVAPRLTKVLLQLEYHPSGFFEKTANLWRAQGRRARLDLKHFRRFVMMQGEETGAWRGEIRDGDVVKGHEEEPSEGKQQRGRGGGKSSTKERTGGSSRRSRGNTRHQEEEKQEKRPARRRGNGGGRSRQSAKESA